MVICATCGGEFKNRGLAGHRRLKHPGIATSSGGGTESPDNPFGEPVGPGANPYKGYDGDPFPDVPADPFADVPDDPFPEPVAGEPAPHLCDDANCPSVYHFCDDPNCHVCPSALEKFGAGLTETFRQSIPGFAELHNRWLNGVEPEHYDSIDELLAYLT